VWSSSQIGLGDETYITNTLVPNDDPLCAVPPHSPTCVMSTEKQDECLLRENWYMFLQERLELEKGMLDSPPGFCVVYETDTCKTDEHDAIRYVFLYLDETSVYYSLCKRAHEWKELWADWLFHRGNRPEIAVSHNLNYEIRLDELRCNIRNFSWPTDNKANATFKNIFATGVFKTLQIFKSHIQSITSNVSASPLLRAEVVKCATSFFNKIHWQKTRDVLVAKRQQLIAANEKRKKIDPTQTTTLTICVREIEAYALECQHLTRICVYKVGQLHGIVNVASFYENSVLNTLTTTGYTEAVDTMLHDDVNHSSTLSHTFTHSMPISKEELKLKTQDQIDVEIRAITNKQYDCQIELKNWIEQLETTAMEIKSDLKIRKLINENIAWNQETLKTVQSFHCQHKSPGCNTESHSSTKNVQDVTKLRVFIEKLRAQLVAEWICTERQTIKYNTIEKKCQELKCNNVLARADVASQKSHNEHSAQDDDTSVDAINELQHANNSCSFTLQMLENNMGVIAKCIQYRRTHNKLILEITKNAHILLGTYMQELLARTETVKSAQIALSQSRDVLAMLSTSPNSHSPPIEDGTQPISPICMIEEFTQSHAIISHEVFCCFYQTNISQDNSELIGSSEDVLDGPRIVEVAMNRESEQNIIMKNPLFGDTISANLIVTMIKDLQGEMLMLSLYTGITKNIVSDVCLKKLNLFVTRFDLYSSNHGDLTKDRSLITTTHSNDSYNSHMQTRSEDKLPTDSVARQCIDEKSNAANFSQRGHTDERTSIANSLIHFAHESELAAGAILLTPHNISHPNRQLSDTHDPTHSHVALSIANIASMPTLPVHDDMQLAITSGPLDNHNIVGIGAFILKNSVRIMHETTDSGASVLPPLPYTENVQTQAVLHLLFAFLKNQETGDCNAIPLQIGNGSSDGLSQNVFNIDALILFFSQNSTCNTTKLLSRLIKLCAQENLKNVRNLDRLLQELQNGAAQAKRHAYNARSFLAKYAFDVGSSVSHFSVMGLNAAVIASGVMGQYTTNNAMRLMQTVEAHFDHIIAPTPAATAVPSSKETGRSEMIGPSLPIRRSHKSSLLDADVSHGSDIPNSNAEFTNDSEPLIMSTVDDLIFQEMNTEISNINDSLAERWLCATGLFGDDCGEIFVRDVVKHFTDKLNPVGDSARKIQILKKLINNGPLSKSPNAKSFREPSSSANMEHTLQRALDRAIMLLEDVCRESVKVNLMPGLALDFHHRQCLHERISDSLDALRVLLHSTSATASLPHKNTRSKKTQ